METFRIKHPISKKHILLYILFTWRPSLKARDFLWLFLDSSVRAYRKQHVTEASTCVILRSIGFAPF